MKGGKFMSKLSIVIPCYNEANKIKNNILKVRDYLPTIPITDYEILLVNDGSKDNIVDVAKEIAVEFKNPQNFRFISYEQNHGKGYAVKTGLENTIGDYVLFMDADLSVDIEAIAKYWGVKDEADVWIASRRHKDADMVVAQGFVRKVVSKCCNILTRLITGLKFEDTQCGFKCFKGDVARKIVQKQTLERWSFDVELLTIAQLNGYTIKDFGVKWENDADSRVSVIDASIRFFKELFYIRKNKKNYRF